MNTHATLVAAKAAYLALLQIPHDSLLRVKAQSALCLMRDFIAEQSELDPEAVQDDFEEAARILRATISP